MILSELCIHDKRYGIGDMHLYISESRSLPVRSTFRVRVTSRARADCDIASRARTLLDSKYLSLLRVCYVCSHLSFPTFVATLMADRPDLRLTYINNDRRPRAMDKALLSSPQLHHLDFTALAYRPRAVCVSEMSELKRCLLQARNLKILRLKAGNASGRLHEDSQESPLNLPF